MKRILFNWYYHRPDLTNHLLSLSDEFELFFIFKHAKPDDPESLTWEGKKIAIIYWGDYRSPYQLLYLIKPDIVVFHDIEAFNQIALNVACRNKNIPTYLLQHGTRGEYEVEDALALANKLPIKVSHTSVWSARFLLSSIRFFNLPILLPLLKFILKRKRYELTVALSQCHGEWRNADYYIELSKYNTGYHKRRDGIPFDRFLIIGNPQFDSYIQMLSSSLPAEGGNYNLLIDCPFCEAVFQKKDRMTYERKNSYLKKMSEWSRKKGRKLYVKLHPLTYENSSYLIQEENIVYFKDADLIDLIKEANLILFVHFSSLTPLIAHYKPFIYFESEYFPANDFFVQKGIKAIDLAYFESESDLEFNRPLSEIEIQDVLYKTDGKALGRLRAIFKGLH